MISFVGGIFTFFSNCLSHPILISSILLICFPLLPSILLLYIPPVLTFCILLFCYPPLPSNLLLLFLLSSSCSSLYPPPPLPSILLLYFPLSSSCTSLYPPLPLPSILLLYFPLSSSCSLGWNDSLNIGSKAVILGNGNRINAEVINDIVNIMVRNLSV